MKNDYKHFFNRQIYYHVLAWMIFIAYEVSIVLFAESASGNYSPARFYTIPYVLNIALFYLHVWIIGLCFSSGRKKLISFLLLIILEISIYIFLVSLLQKTSGLKKRFLLFYFSNEFAFARAIWRGVYFMIFASAYWGVSESFKRIRKAKEMEQKALTEEKERQRLELELVSSKNAFLQAQINPHLLFNTLNFIHSEVQEASETASEAIITLSDMMRYSLVENTMDGKVSLEKEIEQIQNLVKINQYRFNNKLCLEFDARGDVEAVRIVPLVLVPFVENLFKYADLTDAANPAQVRIYVSDGIMVFSTFNKKRKTISFSSPGIGIKNIRTRLQSSYGNRFSLELTDLDSSFSVHLKITL